MPDMSDFNAQVIEEFRANDGVVGGPFQGASMVLVHHTGAKSGAAHVTPLVYRREGDDYAIFASKGGAPTHPAWYHNLKAHPETTIEVGNETLPVVAREVTGEERDRIFAAQAQDAPQFAEYAEKTAGVRTIPVILLAPRA